MEHVENISENGLESEIFEEIKSVLDKHNISDVVLIYNNPDKKLAVQHTCHFYDAARLVATVSKMFKIQISEDMD